MATSDQGVELIDAALAYDWLHTWKGFSADDKRAVEDRLLQGWSLKKSKTGAAS